MNYNDFKNCVIKAAVEHGLTEYELYYTESEDISASAMMHDVQKFMTSVDAGACFRCIFDGKMGYASTELFTEEEAERIVASAVENAKTIEAEDMVFIHEAGDTYQEIEPVKTTVPTGAELIEAVRTLEEKLYEKDSRVMEGSQTYAGFGKVRVALCNSKGLDLSCEYDCSDIAATIIVSEGGEKYSNGEVQTGDFSKLDLEKVADTAVKKAIADIGTESVNSGIYNVVLAKDVVAALLTTFCSVFSADAAQHGLSLLAGKEGEQIASKAVTIIDDPFCKESYIRMSFDGEGVATYTKNIIENGVLSTLMHSLTTAHKAGIASTGNGRKGGYAGGVGIMPYNFYIAKGGAGTCEDIFQKTGTGIYITELNGMHAGANAVTGDFSLAAEGFWIEDGKKAHAVKNFTISGNFYELLQKISLVGDDLELQSPNGGRCFGSPTVMVTDISVAGK